MSSEVNIPLLRKEVEWVEAQSALPTGVFREWWQSTYVGTFLQETSEGTTCGTAYCVAGHIGSQVDQRFTEESSVWVEETNDPLFKYLDDDDRKWVRDGERAYLHVSDVARQELGLNDSQASELFLGYNTATDIRRLAEEYAGEAL